MIDSEFERVINLWFCQENDYDIIDKLEREFPDYAFSIASDRIIVKKL